MSEYKYKKDQLNALLDLHKKAGKGYLNKMAERSKFKVGDRIVDEDENTFTITFIDVKNDRVDLRGSGGEKEISFLELNTYWDLAGTKKEVIKTKGIDEHFKEMQENRELMSDLWNFWHTARVALASSNLKGGLYTAERMNITAKWMFEKYPSHSKMVYYKYLDRNIER